MASSENSSNILDQVNSLSRQLEQHGQTHLLQFQSELAETELSILLAQLQSIDWDQLTKLRQDQVKATDWHDLARRSEPPPAFQLGDDNPVISPKAAREAGQRALESGRVGVVLVAGGQGTRLGFDRPKGLLPIGPVSGRTLFQMHCDRLLGVSRRYGKKIPLFLMTSPATDGDTRDYFESEDQCGLDEGQLTIFCQGTMPAVDAETGRVLLSSKNSLALSPDGHGGLVQALQRSGCMQRIGDLGVDILYYAQVDNPLADLCDPELIGYHLLSDSQMTTQVVKKRFAKEKVGNVVSIDGKVQIIEYSDLPDDAAEQKASDGSLKLWAGNIAIHVFDTRFLQKVVDTRVGLPFHRASKTVPFLDQSGQWIDPAKPNAIKFERFVFDLLPMADKAIVVEGDPVEVFAPVKNATGAPTDTPESCQRAPLAQHRRWIEAAGSTISSGVAVEICPRWALDAQEVAERLKHPVHFAVDTFLV